MDLPINSFKRAITSGRQQIGLWSSLANNIIGRDPGRCRASTGCCSTASTRPTSCRWCSASSRPRLGHRAPDRPPALERRGDDQAVPRRRRADLADPLRPDPGGGRAGRGRRPLSAARHARLRLGLALVALRPGQATITPAARRRSASWCRSRPRQGLDNLEAIAGVEGVDGVFIGPGDLSAALGYLGEPGNPDVNAVIDDDDRPDQGLRQGAGHPDRRRGAGAALHRAGMPVHGRGGRLRHSGRAARSSS